MRWTSGSDSSNVEDRRGSRGGFGLAPMGIGGTVVALVLSLLFGRDIFSGGSAQNPQSAAGDVAPVEQSAAEANEVQFVTFVLDTAQATWAQVLPTETGTAWHDAKLVLFRDQTPTGCGTGQTAMGPFYCPVDQKVYIDLAFYNELRDRFGASGDLAQAYVITHELGHHVQHLLGIDQKVRDAQEQDPSRANQLSVALELQADCYAGVWAHHSQSEQMLEPGEIQEGMNAAAAVGDDRIQRATTGHVNVDNFTHGSSQQRASWFKRGFASGRTKDCDTFAGL
jgi:uncharacterized protein